VKHVLLPLLIEAAERHPDADNDGVLFREVCRAVDDIPFDSDVSAMDHSTYLFYALTPASIFTLLTNPPPPRT